MNYYAAHGEQVTGPFTEAQLLDRLRDNTISSEDFVCREGEEDWHLASTLFPSKVEPVALRENNILDSKPRNFVLGGCLILIVVFIAVWYIHNRSSTLDGEVAITTRTGEYHPIGSVKVSVYLSSQVRPRIDEVYNQYWSYQDKLKDDQAEQIDLQRHFPGYRGTPSPKELPSLGDLAYSTLQNPIRTTMTDANGKFSLSVPRRQDFTIAVSAPGFNDDGVKTYYWIVSQSMDGKSQKKLKLHNGDTYPSGLLWGW